ncbi:unnamed protein product [Darwinula stevensoni]|uniref:Uncharacterized protein n=1 Tax=Darwinula stevensoni TaxID=69355 RepID=A0A7R8XE27_9CRUS|nr:unnamed protein product [Darwinula stevensoni]CAG0889240.1 unnamed protein product [Darwinula stevensoni]
MHMVQRKENSNKYQLLGMETEVEKARKKHPPRKEAEALEVMVEETWRNQEEKWHLDIILARHGRCKNKKFTLELPLLVYQDVDCYALNETEKDPVEPV